MEAIFVLATTPGGTAQALREAQRRAAGSKISLLVTHVASLDPQRAVPPFDPAGRLDEFHAIADSLGVPVTAYACVCQHPRDLAAWFEIGHCIVVVGGQRGSWWRPTPERRLARALTRERQRVVFVEVPS